MDEFGTECSKAAARPRGRPPTRPECRAYFTFLEINTLRRFGLSLAQREEPPLPPNELEALLQQERVPLELRPAFRAVVGRHWPHHAWGNLLSPKEARELGTLTNDPMHRKPRTTWSCEDWKKFQRQTALETKHYGPKAARLLDNGPGLGQPGLYVLTGGPAYLWGLWKALDQWGAAQHGKSLRTFRAWRKKLQARGKLRANGRLGGRRKKSL